MGTVNLEQVYYIGQIFASIAVIASLIYVGKQKNIQRKTFKKGS